MIISNISQQKNKNNGNDTGHVKKVGSLEKKLKLRKFKLSS